MKVSYLNCRVFYKKCRVKILISDGIYDTSFLTTLLERYFH